MKPAKKRMLFNASGCLTHQAIDDYVRGILPADEAAEAENHMDSCILCHEASEGFRMMMSAGNFFPEESMRRRMNGRNPDKHSGKKRGIFLVVAAAASITVFITGFYVLKFDNNKDQTQPLSVATETSSDRSETVSASEPGFTGEGQKNILPGKDNAFKPTVDGLALDEDLSVDRENKITTTGADVSRYWETVTITEKAGKIEGDNIDTPIRDSVFATGGVVPVQTRVGDEEIAEQTPERASGKNINDQKKTEKYKETEKKDEVVVSAARETQSVQVLETGITLYNQGKFQDASEYFILASAGEYRNTALYYLGMTYFSIKEYNKAVDCFDKLLDDKSNAFYELALWQKSSALLVQLKKRQARAVLVKIVEYNGNFRSQAQDKINEIDRSR